MTTKAKETPEEKPETPAPATAAPSKTDKTADELMLEIANLKKRLETVEAERKAAAAPPRPPETPAAAPPAPKPEPESYIDRHFRKDW